MDFTTNESQHGENKSNTSADLQHFPSHQTDSTVTSKDSLFYSEKKEDASTIKGGKRMQLNMLQRLYYQKNLTILNYKKRTCYYKRKLVAQK